MVRLIMTNEEILKKAIEKYDVDETGRVFNRKRGNELKPHYDGIKYPYICVYIGNGITKKINVHRLVAEKYLPNPNKLPQINHKDGNHKNNNNSNLEWCTPSYNVSDGFKRGRIIWNKGNASKERIFGYCRKYPRQIFWILTNNNFQFAKAFWGNKNVSIAMSKNNYYALFMCLNWQYHLQQLVLEEYPIKYLKQFL